MTPKVSLLCGPVVVAIDFARLGGVLVTFKYAIP